MILHVILWRMCKQNPRFDIAYNRRNGAEKRHGVENFEIVNELTSLDPPTLVGFQAVAGIGNRGTFEVASLDHGQRSRVTLWFSFDLPGGPVGAIARRLPLESILDHYAQTALGNLVRRLESFDSTSQADASRGSS